MRRTSILLTRGPGILLAALVVAAALGSVGPRAAPPHRTLAAQPVAATTLLTSTPLLLVHGFSDSCRVFTETDRSTPGTDASTTLGYLTSHGFARSNVKLVGYYDPGRSWTSTWTTKANVTYSDNSTSAPNASVPVRDCDTNVRTDPASGSDATGNCGSYNTGDGYTNDPAMYLACLMAWYINDNFPSRPVNIVAHSMGGLVVRAALAYSGGSNQKAGFPTRPLAVSRIVTVASPHGGLSGTLAAVYNAADTNPDGSTVQEVLDMTVCPNLSAGATCSAGISVPGATWSQRLTTSSFMSGLIAAGTPRGAAGALWMLMGSSIPAAPFTGTPPIVLPNPNALTSLINVFGGGANPDTDWVVQSTSQMALNADVKILYGAVDQVAANGSGQTFDSGGVQYSHEANTCVELPAWTAVIHALTGAIVFPSNEICTQPPYYLNDASTATTQAWSCVGNCSHGFSDLNVSGPAGTQPRSLAEIAHLLLTPPVSQTGHAAHAGDDYPYAGLGMHDRHEGIDPWTEYYGQCDSFAAWKVYENLGGAAAPGGGSAVDSTLVPVAGFRPPDAGISPVVGYAGQASKTGTWGDATDWLSAAQSSGVPNDAVAQPGAIAVWTAAETGWPFGHVGYVTDVYPDGSITVESYNLRLNGLWSTIQFAAGQAGTDTSFGYPALTVPWPAGFVHLGDGPGGGPTQPLPQPTSHYPANTFGPWNGGSFTLAGSAYPGSTHGWYLRLGHGEIGNEMWTNTHAGPTDSTATWSPSLQAGQCYAVDAFVPDNYSNSPSAMYEVSDASFGSSLVPLDENAYDNAFARLGVFQARGDGTLPVTLIDNSAAGLYVAADAVRFVRQTRCAPSRTALVIDAAQPGFALAGSAYPGSNHGWYTRSGHGLRGDEQWTNTHPGPTDSTATWSAVLAPGGCYAVTAFVPDNYSNSPSALYSLGSALGSVNENAYDNQWAPVGTMQAAADGSLQLTLDDNGPANLYVAADAVRFTPASCGGSTVTAPVLDPATPGFSVAGPVFPGSNQGWYTRSGHGLRGKEMWTNTNGSTTASTATWQPNLLPGCYSIQAFIPDNYANDPSATYAVNESGGSAGGGYVTSVNMNGYNNAWAPLGTISLLPGVTLTVTLGDSGNPGSYVAADAMQFLPTSC